jgi:hypothetical protein
MAFLGYGLCFNCKLPREQHEQGVFCPPTPPDYITDRRVGDPERSAEDELRLRALQDAASEFAKLDNQ